MTRSVKYIESRLSSDAHFLYTAFAPVQVNCRDIEKRSEAAQVLVKVGISTVPMNRLVAIHCASPFRVAYAAFTPLLKAKRAAERVETRVLRAFRAYRTRGEWLLLPNTSEMKAEFSLKSKAIIADMTGRPTVWTRVSGQEIAGLVRDKGAHTA